MIALIKRNPLVAYFIITFIISWPIYLSLVAVKHGWTDTPIPYWIHYLASFGPTIGALIVTWIDNRQGWSRRIVESHY